MVLGVGLNAARAGLQVASDQLALVSRNVARMGDPSSTRKLAQVVTDYGGYVHVSQVVRAGTPGLVDSLLAANSSASAEQVRSDALTRLATSLVDPDQGQSPSALIGRLESALKLASANPTEDAAARAAVAAAKDVSAAINQGAAAATAARQDADAGLAQSVERLNELLARFEVANREIVTKYGLADVTDQLDVRDGLLQEISQEIGIRVVSRSRDDVAIYTDSGITLFETTARNVSFTPAASLASGQAGNAVLIDGVPAAGGSGTMTVQSGRIAAFASVRDGIGVTVQTQYDELARGLVDAFAEVGAAGVLPKMPGLFTFAGAAGVPPQGVQVAGLAAMLEVSAAVDPTRGGNVQLLRDGGIAGAAYIYNVGGQAGYSDRLIELGDSLSSTQLFAPGTQVDTSTSLLGLADSTAGWLQEQRKTSSSELEFRNTIFTRAKDALTQSAGVNLDQELAHMLELERSFQANSRLISVLDEMLKTMIQDVR